MISVRFPQSRKTIGLAQSTLLQMHAHFDS